MDTLRAWHAGETGASSVIQVKGAAGSIPALILNCLQRSGSAPLCCLVPDEDTAAYWTSDLNRLLGSGTVVRFPATGRTPYNPDQMTDEQPLIERADVLQHLAEGFDGIVVTSVPAVAELVPPPDTVERETLQVSVGETIAPDALVERLTDQDFRHVEFVESPGQIAQRGGILDVFPFSGEYPIRLEFFGDEIDSIREFDVQTQRSVSRLETARLVPNLERSNGSAQHVPFFDFLPEATRFTTVNEQQLLEGADALFAEAEENYEAARAKLESEEVDAAALDLMAPHRRFLDSDRLQEHLDEHPRLLFGTFADPSINGQAAPKTITLDAKPHPSFNGKIKLLREQIDTNVQRGIETFILCDSHGQASRLRELLESDVDRGRARLVVESVHEGFEWPGRELAIYTDHQIFNRYHRPSTKDRSQSTGLSLRDIQNLNPGDFVVHVDHGIGKFAGMKKITVRGKQQEAVRLNFADDDVLYVNVHALHKLSKYTGKEGHQPTLTRLGSGQWERKKARTKDKVKDIARDLIKLYAERKASDGYAFSSDTVWQQEMEASFPFEDTPDQAEAAEAVKRDMEEPVPMDRLICGDVGFGKTEVGVRAAFKAVQDGKQVAVLCPTTILAQQHFETFRERLERFPVRVDVISRFRSRSEQKEILERLEQGEVDILIGTHRLTSDDVEFKDLGLLIIDEEQRFGVKTKEKLRAKRTEVDTLTLTATPIPRTLQFSLLGARDLSIINTPPANRQPITTEIHTFDKDLIRDAILYETSRGGQVFFIHNRVQTINEIAEMLRAIVPGVRIRTGHGQMPSKELEDVMVGFIESEFDVLVSTSIIENGLDISNANTMIINRADRFGLSELHQLRGRVGRTNRKAFCYMLVPSVHSLTDDARQRLQAVEQFSDLGSGFSIAMRDLDIRGAGSLLGAEQSGFIEDVGYDTYHKILDDAVKELREEEFSDLFDDEDVAPPAPDTTVDVEEDAFIPKDYLSNNVERLNLYRRISNAEDETTVQELREEMADRFGPVPQEVEHLLIGAEIRLRAQRLRLPKAVYKNERLFLYLPSEDADPYFYEHIFHPLLEQLADLDRRYVLKDEADKNVVRAIVQDVPDLETAKAITEQLLAAIGESVDAETVAA